jgi:drug/metabolite transporter (DMT)-like permease
MSRLAGRPQLVAGFAAIYIVWGSTYLAVALALQSIPPLLLMGSRTVAAGLFLLALARQRNPRPPPLGAWCRAAIAGFLLFAGCQGTLAYVQQYMPSGMAAIMLATIPLWILLLNFVMPAGDQRPRVASLAGLAPGLAGVALIAWHGATDGHAAIDRIMVALLLGAALSWAAGTVIAQRHAASTPAIALSGMQLVCGGAVLLVVSTLAGELDKFSVASVSAVSLAALAYLTLAGSVVAFTAYVWLLDHVPGPLVATYTFVNPVAVVLGWAILGERPSLLTLVGMAGVVGSVITVWYLDSPVPDRPTPQGACETA